MLFLDVCAGSTAAWRPPPAASLAPRHGWTGGRHPPPLGQLRPAPGPPGGAAAPGRVLSAPDPARTGWPSPPGPLGSRPQARGEGSRGRARAPARTRAGLKRARTPRWRARATSPAISPRPWACPSPTRSGRVPRGISSRTAAAGARELQSRGDGGTSRRFPARGARPPPRASGRPSGWWAACRVIWTAAAPPPFPFAPLWRLPSGAPLGSLGSGIPGTCGLPAPPASGRWWDHRGALAAAFRGGPASRRDGLLPGRLPQGASS